MKPDPCFSIVHTLQDMGCREHPESDGDDLYIHSSAGVHYSSRDKENQPLPTHVGLFDNRSI